MLLSILPRLNGWKAGRTELGGHGRRMTFTGGKRSSAVLAACEKRRSGLAPSTTQGHGTKTGSSIFGMPTQQVPPGSLPHRPLVAWAGLLARRCTLGGRGLAFGQPPDHLYVLSIDLIHFGTEDSVPYHPRLDFGPVSLVGCSTTLS